MTEKDKKDLAKMLAEEMKKHQPVIQCPNGMTPEYTQDMKNFMDMMTTGKAVAFKAFIGFIVISILTVLGLGIWAKIGAVAKAAVDK